MLEDSIDIRLVMEYVEFGELYDFIALRGRLSEYEARPLFTEIVDALAYLHSQGNQWNFRIHAHIAIVES